MPLGWPQWSRKGESICFDGTPPGNQYACLFRFRMSDFKLEQVANLKDFRQVTDWGSWVGLGPDDSPILLRDNRQPGYLRPRLGCTVRTLSRRA
jgi:hypothetical protein